MVKKKKKTSFLLAVMFVTLLAVGVYTGIEPDSLEDDEVYKLTDISMNVQVEDGYSGKVLTNSPVLVIHGDKKKVKKLKKAQDIPEVVINMKKKRPGEYVGVPEVKGKLFNVTYSFQPSEISVAVLNAKELKFPAFERYVGLAGEGKFVSSIMVDEDAVLLVTDEQNRAIGNVVAEVDVGGMTESGDADGTVYVLDKRGNVMEDVDILTKKVAVYVTLEKLGWLKTQEDINALQDEITTLEKELKDKVALNTGEMDVLVKSDLEKEIDFRQKRLKTKKDEIAKKKDGFVELKASQEEKKKKEVNKSIEEGGKVTQEDIDKQSEEGKKEENTEESN